MPDEAKASDSAFGVDSYDAVDNEAVKNVTKFFDGKPPLFWGRYFTGVDDIGKKDGNYSIPEGKILGKHGIRVLPIARQTEKVGGDAAAGEEDGAENVKAVVKALKGVKDQAADAEGIYLFLDVEDEKKNPPLSIEYWNGWYKGVMSEGKKLILPCLYVRQGSAESFKAIHKVPKKPAALWVARWQYKDHKAKKMYSAPWDPLKMVKSPVDPILWQYQDGEDRRFDCNWTNPDDPKLGKDVLAKHLYLPPEK
jgi:hypothetical protein